MLGYHRTMFADACQKVAEFTKPLIVSERHVDGTVRSECGAFFVIHPDGWFVTAAHFFDSFVKYQGDQNKIREIREINESRTTRPGAPSQEIRPDPSYITNHSMWWGRDGVRITNAYVNRQIDIAVGKLQPFDPSWIGRYPVFRDPDTVRVGTSICRMGFAFVRFETKFDDAANSFQIPKMDEDRFRFANEGMHTRTVEGGRTKDGLYDMRFVETSTPGLKGQSGGPIFDSAGHIYAMQTKTEHLALGFHPTAQYDGSTVVENQFLNVGVGVHVGTILAILEDRKIPYYAEGDESGYRIID